MTVKEGNRELQCFSFFNTYIYLFAKQKFSFLIHTTPIGHFRKEILPTMPHITALLNAKYPASGIWEDSIIISWDKP